ncbi:hypothetical protein PGT21_036952 [Puccinia graminis f. sp. tritici]|uniref:Dynamin GTPase domain-containing protein n=1 Tax=Puccinia graminis f. sp. tritici TaxID=56615 RepID=A0A5B0QQU7_PUCGR|nr:hypothetical protein PGT21_036952 [Puccinia graminis f. sp. tritici]
MLSRFREHKESSPEHLPLTDSKIKSLPVKHGDRIRRLMELTRSLKSSVGHQCDIELPRIVILGDPLAQQTSLLECVTGVKIPREFEHDQRAPIEFRMINVMEVDWSCQVKIRYDYTSQNFKQSPEHVEETNFGEMISEPSKVEGALREAHSYLLREHAATAPRSSNLEAASGTATNKLILSKRAFCKNVVCLEIRGRAVVDLTLVTLPNFIQSHSNRALQDFVLSDYLETNCYVVLLTHGLDRLQVHPAFGLAQRVDPTGNRIIGLFNCLDAAQVAQSSPTANLTRVIQSGFRAFRSGSVTKAPPYLPSKPGDSLSRQRSNKSIRAPRAAWKVMRWQNPYFSEATFESTFDDSELVIFFGEIFSELLQESIPKLLGITSQIYSLSSPMTTATKKTGDDTNDSSFCHVYTTCFKDINRLVTSTIAGEELGDEIEAIYEGLGYRAFSDLPLFVPVPRQEDDLPAFKQLTELADMSLYPEAYRTTDPKKIDIRSRRPRIYLADVQDHLSHMKSLNHPKLSGIGHAFCQKTPLMDLPISKWKSHAHDALSQVFQLLQDAVNRIIDQRCSKTPSFQPRIRKLVYLRLDDIFSAAKKSLQTVLEFELVPYTQSLRRLLEIRAGLMEKYHLSCHLLNVGKEKGSPKLTKRGGIYQSASGNKAVSLENRGSPSLDKTDPKLKGWDVEVNACAEASAYLDLALSNLLETTSKIIERELLEELETCDPAQFSPALETEVVEMTASSDPDDHQSPKSPGTSLLHRSNLDPPSKVLNLVGEIQNIIQDETEELLLLDPFQC